MPSIAIPGNILSGVGGCVYVAEPGSGYSQNVSNRIDIAQWQIEVMYLDAECTHSGTWGAVSRRRVGFDWRFRFSVPLDQDNIPEMLLISNATVALRFNLGDPTQDPSPNSGGSGNVQRYYFSPSALLERARTILDATGRDVIRQDVEGAGNSLLYLLPDENEDGEVNRYLEYLRGRGWVA